MVGEGAALVGQNFREGVDKVGKVLPFVRLLNDNSKASKYDYFNNNNKSSQPIYVDFDMDAEFSSS